MFKKIALLLGLMTSMLFSVSALAAVNAADPYALVDQAAQQTDREADIGVVAEKEIVECVHGDTPCCTAYLPPASAFSVFTK